MTPIGLIIQNGKVFDVAEEKRDVTDCLFDPDYGEMLAFGKFSWDWKMSTATAIRMRHLMQVSKSDWGKVRRTMDAAAPVVFTEYFNTESKQNLGYSITSGNRILADAPNPGIMFALGNDEKSIKKNFNALKSALKMAVKWCVQGKRIGG